LFGEKSSFYAMHEKGGRVRSGERRKKLGTLHMRITFSMLVKLLFFFSCEQIIQVERNKIEGITGQKSHRRKLAEQRFMPCERATLWLKRPTST
jgi:hypothetical protein